MLLAVLTLLSPVPLLPAYTSDSVWVVLVISLNNSDNQSFILSDSNLPLTLPLVLPRVAVSLKLATVITLLPSQNVAVND